MNRISRGGFHIRTNRTRLFHGAVLTAMTVASLVVAGCSDDGDEETSSTALCGGEEYITATHFCFADVVYEKCGGQTWNPTTQICDRRTPEQAYRFVSIGSQVWLAENLNYYNPSWDNDVLTDTDVDDKGSWCYGNTAANCTAKGRLYTWNAANEACPTGWHLPDVDDWKDLLAEAGATFDGNNNITSDRPTLFRKLRAASWSAGTDDIGFSALPSGRRAGRDAYEGITNQAVWWSSTSGMNDGYAIRMRVADIDGGTVGIVPEEYRMYGFSVRCVRN